MRWVQPLRERRLDDGQLVMEPDPNYIASADGRYTVTKTDDAGTYYYGAWRRPHGTTPATMLAMRLADSKAAREVCEQHAADQQKLVSELVS